MFLFLAALMIARDYQIVAAKIATVAKNSSLMKSKVEGYIRTVFTVAFVVSTAYFLITILLECVYYKSFSIAE